MRTLTRRTRRLAVAAAGLAAACTLAVPAAAQAATGYTPNPHQWYFSNWNVQQDVWPTSQGAGVTVAVLGSGVQASIPDLQGVVETGADELGDSGNGEQDYAPSGGHETAVAALIAGQGTNGGPVGVAPQAKILPVHITDPSGGTAANAGTAGARGIRYATDHGAQVINMSNGTSAPSADSCDPQLQDAINYALAHNVVLVAASGDTNLGQDGPREPAICPGVIDVGAVEQDGSLWQYSTQTPNVAVAAPGDHLYTVSSDGQQYSTDSYGTSFSTPLVAGAAALIRSKYPSMPWYTVAQRLTDTAVATGPVPNDGTGYGIININKALNVDQYPVSASAPNPVYARYQTYLKSTGQAGKGTGGQQAAPTATASSSSGGSAGLIIGIIVIIIVILAAIAGLIVLARRRSRKGPRNPGGPGSPGGPSSTYSPPPGQPQYPPGGYQR